MFPIIVNNNTTLKYIVFFRKMSEVLLLKQLIIKNIYRVITFYNQCYQMLILFFSCQPLQQGGGQDANWWNNTVNGRINGEYDFYSAEISNNRRAEGELVIIFARLNKSDIHHL